MNAAQMDSSPTVASRVAVAEAESAPVPDADAVAVPARSGSSRRLLEPLPRPFPKVYRPLHTKNQSTDQGQSGSHIL